MALQTKQVNVQQTLAAAIANNGTLTISYPSGTNQAYFTGGNANAKGVAIINDSDVWTEAASQISLSYGASNITLTNLSGVSWAAGAKLSVGLAYADAVDYYGGQRSAAITSLTAATGTANDTVADVGASFSQSGLNNINQTFATKINLILAALKKAGITL